MSNPMTPLDRARRVLELSKHATPPPWSVPFAASGHGEEIHNTEAGEQIGSMEEAGNRIWAVETRTLAPALAEDVTQLTALWERCKPLCQHVPGVAEMARALGLLPAREEESDAKE